MMNTVVANEILENSVIAMNVVDARWYYKGNLKVGNIATFSKLPGDMYFETSYGIVQGTCSGCCEHCGCSVDGKRPKCYVFKSHRYPSVVDSQARNTLSVRNNPELAYQQLSDSMKRKKKKPEAGRYDQSGEIISKEEIFGMSKVAIENPKMPFYVYTKKYDVIVAMLLAGLIPKNLTVLISIWHTQGIREYLKVAHLPNVKAFVYCDKNSDSINGWGEAEYAQHGIIIQTFCGAYGKNGKMNHNITCDKCRKCFNRSAKAKVIGCWDH